MLAQILEPDALDRLNRIRLVKASRAEDIESRLIMLARTGQIRQKITEAQLREMLEAAAEQRREEEEGKVRVERRRGAWDDEDDLLDL